MNDTGRGDEFGQVRERPCPQCGGEVFYEYGNWHCKIGPDENQAHCGWSTRTDYAGGNRSTLESCPSCGNQVVYNGNYFCAYLGQGCDWALPSPARKQADRDLAFRLTGRST